MLQWGWTPALDDGHAVEGAGLVGGEVVDRDGELGHSREQAVADKDGGAAHLGTGAHSRAAHARLPQPPTLSQSRRAGFLRCHNSATESPPSAPFTHSRASVCFMVQVPRHAASHAASLPALRLPRSARPGHWFAHSIPEVRVYFCWLEEGRDGGVRKSTCACWRAPAADPRVQLSPGQKKQHAVQSEGLAPLEPARPGQSPWKRWWKLG